MTTAQIRELILSAFPDAIVQVENPLQDGQHFGAIVVSAQFNGLSMVKQQRLVNQVLQPYFDSGAIHALQLKTYTPAEWAQISPPVQIL
ncbi:MAG: BolA family protein [Pseudanabaenaceae cyanobacterium]